MAAGRPDEALHAIRAQAGRNVELPVILEKWGRFMDFYKRAALVCQQIPEGKAATYGQIALLCGKPKNSRQVGYALNRELAGEDAPAHRVVNAKGILSGAAAFATSDLQKQMLEKEGVHVSWTEDGWKVDLKKDGWKNTMDEALWLREEFEQRKI